MNIGFIGLGQLGLPCALAIEKAGHCVRGADFDPRVAEILRTRVYPHKEVHVPQLLLETKLELLSLREVVRLSDIVFVAVQTPHDPRFDGSAPLPYDRADFDYTALKAAFGEVCRAVVDLKVRRTVVVISTVLPGTVDRELLPMKPAGVDLCYNPFFIAMGTTVDDFLNPEFVLLGHASAAAADEVMALYSTMHQAPVKQMTIREAELTKVAYNTFISTKLVFANTIMEIAHRLGCNVDVVMEALGSASQRLISTRYLRGGMGDGGKCHPRDNIALSWLASRLGMSYDFFGALMTARERQTLWLAQIMAAYRLPKIVLGQAFKPESNITAGSPAVLLVHYLRAMGEDVQVYDPEVGIGELPNAVGCYVIATQHQVFYKLRYPEGSVVIDPWGKMPDMARCVVVRIGRP